MQTANLVVLACCFVLLALPTLIAGTSFPRYYEDESWDFLGVFEQLRGNGFSAAALGEEGHFPLGTYPALMTPFLAILPFGPEVAVRLVSALGFLGIAVFGYLTARKIAPASAYLAPVFLLATPLAYTTLRYGRPETIAGCLAMAALASAVWRRPSIAGVLAGLAVCVHPVQVWVGAPIAIVLVAERDRRDFGRFVIGGLIGVAPQALWIATHGQEVARFSSQFLVTSSISAGRFTVLKSMANEVARYSAYIGSSPVWQILIQGLLFIVLPVDGIARSKGTERLLILALLLGPALSLMVLSEGKNPYYFVSALPAWSIAAAISARHLPRRAWLPLAGILLALTAIVEIGPLGAARGQPPVSDLTENIAGLLPKNAAVFSQMRFAGLIRVRPDLRFFSYHALSTKTGGWAYPTCAMMQSRLHQIVSTDTRASSKKSPQPNTAYLVWGGHDAFLPYLQSIYGQGVQQRDIDCLVGPNPPASAQTCAPNGGRCEAVQISAVPISLAQP